MQDLNIQGEDRTLARKVSFDINDTTKSIPRLVLMLAWPVFMEQILTTLVSYADQAMVGALGKNATAAISISNSPIFVLNGVVLALGIGITAMVAQAVGAGDKALVKNLIRHAILVIIYLAVPIAIICAVLCRQIPIWMGAEPEILDDAAAYNLIVASGRAFILASMVMNSVFRGYGDTKTPLVVNTVMNVVNVVGNYFLINPTRPVTILGLSFTMPGAGWGVRGAAVATALGMMAAGIITIIIAFTRDNEYKISIRDSYRLDRVLAGKIFNISFPAMLERFVMSSSGVFVTRAIASLGTTAVAANSLFLTAESMSFMPAFAFQTAATTLMGQCLGARRIDRAEKFTRTTLIMGTLTMCATTIFLYTCAEFLLGLFTPDADVIALGTRCLHVTAFVQAPQVIGWIYAGALRGAGDTKITSLITVLTTVFIRTIGEVLVIRAFGYGLVEAQYVVFTEIAIRGILMGLRYRAGKWKTMSAI